RLIRTQPGDDYKPEAVPAIERRFGAADGRLGGERQIQIHGLADLGTKEPGRRDADDGEGDACRGQGSPDNVSGAAKALLPQPVTDHGCRSVRATAADVVGRRQRAADTRVDAERAKQSS